MSEPAVEPVELDQLTDEDAQPDGFATADLLRQEIESLYGERLATGEIPAKVMVIPGTR